MFSPVSINSKSCIDATTPKYKAEIQIRRSFNESMPGAGIPGIITTTIASKVVHGSATTVGFIFWSWGGLSYDITTTRVPEFIRLNRARWIVTANNSSLGPAPNIIDGDLNSYWGTPNPIWFQVDMLTPQIYNSLGFTPMTGGFGPKDYVIYISNDGSNWSLAGGGTLDSGAGEQFIDLPVVTSRFIKIYVVTNYGSPYGLAEFYVAQTDVIISTILEDTLILRDDIMVAEPKTRTVADSSTAFNDAYSGFGLNWAIQFAETLPFQDRESHFTAIVTVPLSKSAGDTINKWKEKNARLFIGMGYELSEEEILDLDDQVYLDGFFNQGSVLTDSLSLDDTVRIVEGINVDATSAFDTMQYNWDDALVVAAPGYFAFPFQTDSINNWLDAVKVAIPAQKSSADRINLADNIQVLLAIFVSHIDELDMNDSIGRGTSERFTDTFSMADSFLKILQDVYSQGPGDALVWQDNVAISVKNASMINYYRRYLGDVQR